AVLAHAFQRQAFAVGVGVCRSRLPGSRVGCAWRRCAHVQVDVDDRSGIWLGTGGKGRQRRREEQAAQGKAHGSLQVQPAALHPTTNEAVPVFASLNETIDTLQSAPASLRNGTDSPGPRNRDDGRSAPAWVRFTRAPRSLT